MLGSYTFSDVHLHPVMPSVPGFAQKDESREQEHAQRHKNGEHYEPEANFLYEVGARRKNHSGDDEKQQSAVGRPGYAEQFPLHCFFHWSPVRDFPLRPG